MTTTVHTKLRMAEARGSRRGRSYHEHRLRQIGAASPVRPISPTQGPRDIHA